MRVIRWTHHHEYIMKKPLCSAYSPSPTLLSSCKAMLKKIRNNGYQTGMKDVFKREKKNEGMREEQWESETQ